MKSLLSPLGLMGTAETRDVRRRKIANDIVFDDSDMVVRICWDVRQVLIMNSW